MDLFKVYPLYNVTPVSAKGAYVWDDKGTNITKEQISAFISALKSELND